MAETATDTANSDERSKLGVSIQIYSVWFLVIGFATFANYFSLIGNGKLTFGVGLFIPQILAEASSMVNRGYMHDENLQAQATAMASTSTVVFCLMPLVFFFFAHSKYSWPFVLGVFLYAIDALMFLMAIQVVSAAVHLIGIFLMARGAICCRKLRKLQELEAFEPEYAE